MKRLEKFIETIQKKSTNAFVNPPRTFREALNFIVFYREIVSSLEGFGISTFAQLDRMLAPYYESDLKNGRITLKEAKQLLGDLLIYTDVRFESRGKRFYETSTTIELGGCDKEGNLIYNDITRMILDAVIEVKNLSTKINRRISSKHPKEYFKQIAAVQLANLPCIMMHNDDVIIPARVKYGQDEKDARLYVGGGCHEVVLSNTEVCTRADTWINVPGILLQTMENRSDAQNYEEFYRFFLNDVKAYHEHIVTTKNKYEALWCEKFPLPLYSSSFVSALEKGKDITEGGAKYNSTALSMVGAATTIDSLYSVKKLVFDNCEYTLADFSRIVKDNFKGQEYLRQYILHKLPKYGTGNESFDRFSAKVLADLSGVSGQTNARGGKYYPAFYPHDIYINLGLRTNATPDGRMANTPLSRGASPSEFIECSPLDVIQSMSFIDFTDYTDSFIVDITLPEMDNNAQNIINLTAIIEGFLQAKGSSLQFNLIRREDLLDAQKHPERHENLNVRVCGYSAKFTSLGESIQKEIVDRAIR